MLEREEYVEQAHFFRALSERLPQNQPLQELLGQVQEELLATTKLPLALSFLLGELRHAGEMAGAMRKLPHYFTPFQTYVIAEAENERGRFDMHVATEILRYEAEYRGAAPTQAGSFMYQFEALCRNRLRYDPGLEAIAQDPIFDEPWRTWVLIVRRQIGIVDFADLVYVRSQHYVQERLRREQAVDPACPALFGEKEGKIAWANRRKDPLYLFAALQRHLGYPQVPRLKPVDQTPETVTQILRRMERMEVRMKLLEDEQRGGIDLTKFYGSSRTLPKGAPPPKE